MRVSLKDCLLLAALAVGTSHAAAHSHAEDYDPERLEDLKKKWGFEVSSISLLINRLVSLSVTCHIEG